jgi:hypothetical protein
MGNAPCDPHRGADDEARGSDEQEGGVDAQHGREPLRQPQ